jgi:N-acetylmuramoyl-L-alanine amidase
MTEKNKTGNRRRSICRSLIIASLCAGLLLAGCGANNSAQSQVPEAGSESAATQNAAAEKTGQEASGTEAAEASAAATTAQSAASAATGDQYADPDWAGSGQSPAFSAKDKGLVIVLDPGHASQVPETQEPVGPGSTEMKEADTVGTFGPASGLHEYDLTMDVSQKLRTELEERGYEVKMTHSDTFNPIGCVDRAAVANENKADAFIRIHANGSENTEANGAMTICITKDNPYHPELYSASARLSDIILNTYCDQTGAKKEYVWETDTMTGNNWAEVPTTLIELGYMTNIDEDLRMNQDSYQKIMAAAIADGLDKWFAEMPEEELVMHPSLSGDNSGSADTSSTSEEAAEDSTAWETGTDAGNTEDGEAGSGETDDADDADGSQDSGAESGEDGQEGSPAQPTPSTGTPAGTSSGNGTGVTAGSDNDSE